MNTQSSYSNQIMPGARPPTPGELVQINVALQWLDTLIKSPAVNWEPSQKIAAQVARDTARASIINMMMGTPPGCHLG